MFYKFTALFFLLILSGCSVYDHSVEDSKSDTKITVENTKHDTKKTVNSRDIQLNRISQSPIIQRQINLNTKMIDTKKEDPFVWHVHGDTSHMQLTRGVNLHHNGGKSIQL